MGDAKTVDGDGATLNDGSVSRHSSILPGSAIGSLIVLRVLGEGGMGVVYAAYDPKLDRQVAVKLLHQAEQADPENAQARLMREAQAMAKLSHPNVLPVYEVGLHRDEVILVLELVRGPSLDQWLEKRRSWSDILTCLTGAGRGLAAAHAAGLVHRDFKPENVLVGEDGRPRVADFGIAGLVERKKEDPADGAWPERESLLEAPLTRAGAVVGTPAYMAPEQLAGRALDGRVDQFAFCVVAWEALFGERPFGNTVTEHFEGLMGNAPLRATPKTSRVPRSVVSALRRGLRLDPEKRFGSMGALLEALQPTPRGRWVLPVAVAAFVAAGVGYGMASREAPDPCPAPSLEGTWDTAARAALRDAFSASELPFAPATLRATERALDTYGAQWAEQHVEACRDSEVRHVQSEALLDSRMRCLEDRRLGLAAVARALSEADDALVRNAVGSVVRLPSPTSCQRTSDLAGTTPVPESPSVRARLEALRGRLAEVRAEFALGRFAAGLGRAVALESETRELGYEPLLAEVSYVTASFRYRVEGPIAAIPLLEQAMRSAGRAGMDDLLLRAAARRTGLIGLDPAHSEAALAQRPVLEAMMAWTHDASLRAEALNSIALSLHIAGDVESSVEVQRRVVELRIEHAGEGSIEVMWALGNLGSFLKDRGDLDAATATLERAVRIGETALGRQHPNLTIPLSGLGVALWMQGEYAAAEAPQRRAHALRREASGGDSPSAADAAWYLGRTLVSLGQREEGLQLLNHSVEGLQGQPGSRLAWALRARAEARRRGDNAEGARADLNRAERMLAESLSASHSELARTRDRLARLALERGDLTAARRWHEASLPVLSESRTRPDWHLHARITGASLLGAEGDREGAARELVAIIQDGGARLSPDAPVVLEAHVVRLELGDAAPSAWDATLRVLEGRDPELEARCRRARERVLGGGADAVP
ncbi:MAG: protein kinase [Sandaracinaceae bacterium]